jgi:hypothetical protein
MGGEAQRVHILAAGAFAAAPRICFPDRDPAEIRGWIDRGASSRFEELSRDPMTESTLYRDRLLDLTPALEHGPDGCDVLEPAMLAPYLELLLLNAALDREPGIVAAHAAAVARDGIAALVCGDGGAGKTTLTVALLRQGCAYLTDEVALMDPIHGSVRAYPRFLGIREGTLSLIEQLKNRSLAFSQVSLSGDRKWFVDPRLVAAAGTVGEARLGHVWFLSGFASAPAITAMEPWDAARRFARSLRQVRGTGMDRVWTAMEIVRHCRAYEVIAGPPEATAAALMQRMAEGEGGRGITAG